MALDRWNLSVLFTSEEEFLATLEEFKSLIPLVGDFQGKLSNEEKLAEYLRLDKKANMLLTDPPYGVSFLVAGYYYTCKEPCYYGAVYEHTDDDLSCEGEISLIAVSEERFEDNGHALAWAMQQ